MVQFDNRMRSQELYSNKSGLLDKKPSNLVVQTELRNAFDNRWAELKIQGRNIASRSNHVTVVFGEKLFVHGGYDVEKGILGDFYELDLSGACEEFTWKKLNNLCEGREIKLKSHTGVNYKEHIYLFGGERSTNLGNNVLYKYDLVSKVWSGILPTNDVPKVDSHSVAIVDGKMYIYGGYISEEAENMRNIVAFEFQTEKWSVEHRSNPKGNEPEGRSCSSMAAHDGKLYIFGGTNGEKTLNDLWTFDIKAGRWQKIDSKDTPEPRRGHSLINYQDYIFMFGGIQDVTKEKNDIYIYQVRQSQWNKIHTTTNSIYECSPTLKKSARKKSPDNSPRRLSPQKSERFLDDPMKKIIHENKQKKFQERKKELLKQFEDEEGTPRRKRDLSPTTESMLKTLQSIGNQDSNRKEISQEILYDESHRFIIGKKPCARDGQSVNILNDRMYIFGGDRHLMAFNDLYQFDLEKGIKSLELYKSAH